MRFSPVPPGNLRFRLSWEALRLATAGPPGIVLPIAASPGRSSRPSNPQTHAPSHETLSLPIGARQAPLRSKRRKAGMREGGGNGSQAPVVRQGRRPGRPTRHRARPSASASRCPPAVTPALSRGPGKPGDSGARGPRTGVRDRPGPRLKAGVTAGDKEGGCGRGGHSPAPRPPPPHRHARNESGHDGERRTEYRKRGGRRKNDLKEKNALDRGHVRHHISHGGGLGVAELHGAEPEGRKNLVKSVTYRLICPEQAFFP